MNFKARRFPAPGLTAQERAARTPRQVKFALRRRRGVWEGTVLLPMGLLMPGGQVAPGATRPMAAAQIPVTARAGDKQSAIANAANLAQQIASNPLVAAALPPGTGAAVNAISMVAKHAPIGKLEDALKKLGGAGGKRLIDAIKFW